MLPIAPGTTHSYTATPVPPTSVPSEPPVWTSSNPKNAPVTSDATGLVGTVTIPAEAVVETAFVLTVTYNNADGSVSQGTISETIVASPDIKSFTIERTK